MGVKKCYWFLKANLEFCQDFKEMLLIFKIHAEELILIVLNVKSSTTVFGPFLMPSAYYQRKIILISLSSPLTLLTVCLLGLMVLTTHLCYWGATLSGKNALWQCEHEKKASHGDLESMESHVSTITHTVHFQKPKQMKYISLFVIFKSNALIEGPKGGISSINTQEISV